MKRLHIVSAVVGCIGCLAVVTAQAGRDSTTGTVQKAFVSGGQVHLDLSAGDYRISGSPEPSVRVEWQVRYPDEARDVRIDADIDGKRARIVTDGPSSHFRVRIQVPQRSDLVVRLTAGDISIDGIEGNKDVESHAGDMSIDMRRAEDYNRVEASVWAGDLEIRPLNVSKGGLFRSYNWSGRGPYRLHAHLKAGDLRIY
jgi:hypothetical protein